MKIALDKIRWDLIQHRVPIFLLGVFYVHSSIVVVEVATIPPFIWRGLFLVVGVACLLLARWWSRRWLRNFSAAAAVGVAFARGVALLLVDTPVLFGTTWIIIALLQFWAWPTLLPPRMEPTVLAGNK